MYKILKMYVLDLILPKCHYSQCHQKRGLRPTGSKVVKMVIFDIFLILNRIIRHLNRVNMQKSPILTIQTLTIKGHYWSKQTCHFIPCHKRSYYASYFWSHMANLKVGLIGTFFIESDGQIFGPFLMCFMCF